MIEPVHSEAPLLEMKSIGKSFPGVRALDGVSFDLYPGELHALVGENGAGKSTLMKILSGVYPYPQYEGEILIDGKRQRSHSIHAANDAGIAIVFQELSLVPEMTVGENIWLGREPHWHGVVEWDLLYSQAAKVLHGLHLDLDVHAPAGQLGIGQQQMVEIAKALSQQARILVLDEPTAALTESESQSLFEILKGLRSRGIGLIYISHRLEEVFELSDRITVLRDGRTVETRRTADFDEQSVIAQMVGRELTQVFPKPGRTPGKVVLEARGVYAEKTSVAGQYALRDVGLKVREGEVLGIAGLMGSGRTALLETLFGSYSGDVRGELMIDGTTVHIEDPAIAIAYGIALVTEDRKRSGLFLDQSILQNATLPALRDVSGRFITDEVREIANTEPMFQNLRVKTDSVHTEAGTLSGGNQQKVVLCKWLLTKPRVLLLDEPTRGVDIGAKQEIYAEIDRLAREGLAVILVSSELEEVLGLSDRVLVLHQGRVAGEFTREQAKPEAVMACATGQTQNAAV